MTGRELYQLLRVLSTEELDLEVRRGDDTYGTLPIEVVRVETVDGASYILVDVQ